LPILQEVKRYRSPVSLSDQKIFRLSGYTAPSMNQAGIYSAVRHYLKAVQAVGTDDADKVTAKMRGTPVDDMMMKNATIGENGRVFDDMYLFQVKAPGESKGPWDYFNLVKTIPAAQAYVDPKESGCPLVK
jgi:branched-chain amino acid transport system substrate-binding protein